MNWWGMKKIWGWLKFWRCDEGVLMILDEDNVSEERWWWGEIGMRLRGKGEGN